MEYIGFFLGAVFPILGGIFLFVDNSDWNNPLAGLGFIAFVGCCVYIWLMPDNGYLILLGAVAIGAVGGILFWIFGLGFWFSKFLYIGGRHTLKCLTDGIKWILSRPRDKSD